jgi:D-alanyl-D-alanine carboxypeptidase (penicillin-binding protein 5/6)
MKTGFTEESGYGIVASIKRDGRRLFLAMSGLDRARTCGRSAQDAGMGHPRLRTQDVVRQGRNHRRTQRLWRGSDSAVVKAPGAVDILLPITNPDRLTARISYRWPLRAPIEKGPGGCSQGLYRRYVVAGDAALCRGRGKGPLHSQALDALIELAQFWL